MDWVGWLLCGSNIDPSQRTRYVRQSHVLPSLQNFHTN